MKSILLPPFRISVSLKKGNLMIYTNLIFEFHAHLQFFFQGTLYSKNQSLVYLWASPHISLNFVHLTLP